MAEDARKAVAPLYLLASLFLGASAHWPWASAALQLGGIAIIAWSALTSRRAPPPSRSTRLLLLLFAAALVVVALQLVPIPPSLWAHGARSRLWDGYHVLGVPAPWLPFSLAPYETLAALLRVIPALALFCAMVRLRAYSSPFLAAALLAVAAADMLALVAGPHRGAQWQSTSVSGSSFGPGSVLFGGPEEMASLLVISMPFVAALAGGGKVRKRFAGIVALAAFGLLLIAGVVLTGALAACALTVPVLAASMMILLSRRSVLRRISVALALLSLVAAVFVFASSWLGHGAIGQQSGLPGGSREAMMKTMAAAIGDYMPFGSGLGSFAQVYRLYQAPGEATAELLHAQSHYAELALELGGAGILLMLLFIGWWVAAVLAVWWKDEGGRFAKAASIASGVILVHSLIDAPLRTGAISACFAMCLGLLADRRAESLTRHAPLRPTRHVVIA